MASPFCQGMLEHLQRQSQCKSLGARSSVVAGVKVFTVAARYKMTTFNCFVRGYCGSQGSRGYQNRSMQNY